MTVAKPGCKDASIKMEGLDGIELLKQFKEKHDADVIVMTLFFGD
jgi:DNA-binding NtrC family response regulator